jgi:hypothetical protein
MSGSGTIDPGITSSIEVNLGLDFGMASGIDRSVSGTGGSDLPSHTEFSCPGSDPISGDGPVSWRWMEIPLTNPVVEVNADGTIQGTATTTFTLPSAGTRKMTWSLTPMRQ